MGLSTARVRPKGKKAAGRRESPSDGMHSPSVPMLSASFEGEEGDDEEEGDDDDDDDEEGRRKDPLDPCGLFIRFICCPSGRNKSSSALRRIGKCKRTSVYRRNKRLEEQ